MDFHQSVDNITQELKNIDLLVENSKNGLSIIVGEKFEIILTHYPLWNNEQFLYMVGDLHKKVIIKKNIPEKNIVDFFLHIKNNSCFLASTKTLLN